MRDSWSEMLQLCFHIKILGNHFILWAGWECLRTLFEALYLFSLWVVNLFTLPKAKSTLLTERDQCHYSVIYNSGDTSLYILLDVSDPYGILFNPFFSAASHVSRIFNSPALPFLATWGVAQWYFDFVITWSIYVPHSLPVEIGIDHKICMWCAEVTYM